MRMTLIAATLVSLAIPSTPVFAGHGSSNHERADYSQHDQGRHEGHRGNRHDNRRQHWQAVPQVQRQDYSRYDYNRPDPRYGNYRADRYYQSGAQYPARQLAADERIYRGTDNRYYCRRSDGTTGLIIGGLAGGALGNVIAPGGSKRIGTLLGGGLGALIGRAVDRDNGGVTCR